MMSEENPTREELLKVAKWLEDTCPIIPEFEIAEKCFGMVELEQRTRQRRKGYEFAVEHIRTETTALEENK